MSCTLSIFAIFAQSMAEVELQIMNKLITADGDEGVALEEGLNDENQSGWAFGVSDRFGRK